MGEPVTSRNLEGVARSLSSDLESKIANSSGIHGIDLRVKTHQLPFELSHSIRTVLVSPSTNRVLGPWETANLGRTLAASLHPHHERHAVAKGRHLEPSILTFEKEGAKVEVVVIPSRKIARALESKARLLRKKKRADLTEEEERRLSGSVHLTLRSIPLAQLKPVRER